MITARTEENWKEWSSGVIHEVTEGVRNRERERERERKGVIRDRVRVLRLYVRLYLEWKGVEVMTGVVVEWYS